MQCAVCGAEHDDATSSCPLCGADLATFAPGTVIADRYDVRSLLGRGGMGSVYRAFDRVLDEEVALKVQLAEEARGPEAERRFRTEVKLARQVSHPNVCRLHDGAQQGASRWISMELVEGETLASRVRGGPLDADEVWDLALQAAEGLAAVHRAGIVHRDLKPANLMVDHAGRLRLMDFGIARPATAGEAGTGGYAQGSPEYMSPEQARGRPADARSDVYSLGVAVFELATGHVPFRAESPVATLLQHLETPPPLDQVPEALRPVVGRALAKDPGDRFPDGAAMAVALREAREGHRVPPAPRRRPRRHALALAAALAVTAAGLVLYWPGPWIVHSPSTPDPLPPPSAAPSPSPRAARPSPPPVASPTPSPPASRPAAGPIATPAPASAQDPGEASPAPIPATPEPALEPPLAAATAAAGAGEETGSPLEETGRTAVVEADGALLVIVQPWADVSVDGVPRGQTPLGQFPLPPGPHQVLLTHPDYRPYPRRVVIRPGETLRLRVDLRTDGVRRR